MVCCSPVLGDEDTTLSGEHRKVQMKLCKRLTSLPETVSKHKKSRKTRQQVRQTSKERKQPVCYPPTSQ